MEWKTRISSRTISRLSLYRRLLADFSAAGSAERVYSHELAHHAGVSAAQVRRDIMALGYSGTPNTGYDIRALGENIAAHIDAPAGQQVCLVGIGNLGKAILSYFSSGKRARLKVVAAFDSVPDKTSRVLYGCRCYLVEQMAAVIRQEQITVGIIAVPATAAQETADRLVAAGVSGILNFAPIPIKVPFHVYSENVDITIKLETVAFFARRSRKGRGEESDERSRGY
jgi:redox-sensing transcriptional repressor